MWQGGDTLTAPVIEIDRGRNVLRAWGEDTGAAPVVRAAFVTAKNKGQPPNAAQVRSQTLLYSDKDRRADFHGAVTMEQADGVVHADDGQVFLKPEQAARKGGAQGDSARQTSQIERIVAQGHVVFTQPGRKGEGEKLVYTADDGRYVLTGTPDALPRLWDSTHGTTTGAALLFNTQDDSVEVSGGKSSAVTQTRAPR
jgi:lipopolysaccharide export system protein LptA